MKQHTRFKDCKFFYMVFLFYFFELKYNFIIKPINWKNDVFDFLNSTVNEEGKNLLSLTIFF